MFDEQIEQPVSMLSPHLINYPLEEEKIPDELLQSAVAAIPDPEKPLKSDPPALPEKAVHVCKHCHKVFPRLSNKNKHERTVHGDAPKKYLKHIKKDATYVCIVCGKTYKQSFNLKIHYGRDHTKEELEGKKIPVVPVAHYSRRIVQRDPKKSSLMANIERERREAFL